MGPDFGPFGHHINLPFSDLGVFCDFVAPHILLYATGFCVAHTLVCSIDSSERCVCGYRSEDVEKHWCETAKFLEGNPDSIHTKVLPILVSYSIFIAHNGVDIAIASNNALVSLGHYSVAQTILYQPCYEKEPGVLLCDLLPSGIAAWVIPAGSCTIARTLI